MAAGDRDFLRARCDELNEQLPQLKFALPSGPIHGDAHTRNLLTDNGQVVLLDFEAAAIGPREWDLLPTAIATERYGLEEEQYRQFADAYGFDVRGLARLSGAARDPGADHDDMDHAERRREPGRRRRVRPASHLTARKRLRTCLALLLISPTTTPGRAAARSSRSPRRAAGPDHQHVRHAVAPSPTAPRAAQLPDYLRLWRFERYYRLSADQLPHVLCREAVDISRADVQALAARRVA